MDLTQLANLGEFIGGVAVLATLVYLAVQVRQSAVAQRAATAGKAIRSNIVAFSNFRQMQMNESMGEARAKAQRDEQPLPGETVRLQAVVNEAGWTAAPSCHRERADLRRTWKFSIFSKTRSLRTRRHPGYLRPALIRYSFALTSGPAKPCHQVGGVLNRVSVW